MRDLKLISIEEAAELRGCTRSAIIQLISRDRINVERILGKPFVYKSEISNFKRKKPGPKLDTIFHRKVEEKTKTKGHS